MSLSVSEKEPKIRQLIQGAFQCEWIREAQQKDREQRNLRMKRLASSTKASEGHARRAEHFAEVRVRLSVRKKRPVDIVRTSDIFSGSIQFAWMKPSETIYAT